MYSINSLPQLHTKKFFFFNYNITVFYNIFLVNVISRPGINVYLSNPHCKTEALLIPTIDNETKEMTDSKSLQSRTNNTMK